ncbi:hypothetical protein TNCV_2484041 [Trichonephila clavipes]|uniref:Uncharacterized protein n=1 Tax=Trichonephila clavipes TaxID=2585209 RepID=A0A8X6VZF1_TRICX|nr:hypothetical protein TNCV_2484041 [Trichonephila clavipes]
MENLETKMVLPQNGLARSSVNHVPPFSRPWSWSQTGGRCVMNSSAACGPPRRGVDGPFIWSRLMWGSKLSSLDRGSKLRDPSGTCCFLVQR